MLEENEKMLLNFIIDEIKGIREVLNDIKSEMVTKDYCHSKQENCPMKEELVDTQKKTSLNLAK